MSLWHKPAAAISTITSRGPGGRSVSPSTNSVVAPSKTMPRMVYPQELRLFGPVLHAIEVEHLDRVAAHDLVHLLVGEMSGLVGSDLGRIRPGAVAVRVVAL